MAARISIEPGKRSGQPCVRGLRITVWDVLDWLAGGMSEKEILADYPELEPDAFPPFTISPPTRGGVLHCEVTFDESVPQACRPNL